MKFLVEDDVRQLFARLCTGLAAALLAATQIFPAGTPSLLLPKTTVLGQLTMSIALALP